MTIALTCSLSFEIGAGDVSQAYESQLAVDEDAPAVGTTASSSLPVKAPVGAPNIVIILLDDIGFADTSAFGGIPQTPALEKLAAAGLRYINFNTTGMCSPTRAALLTGRNHHRVGFGVAEAASDYPGYDFRWRPSTASIAEVLRLSGYSTAAFGKWHNTPYSELTPVGPFDRWPTRLGFELFYGFIAGRDSQWEPASLFRNTTAVEAPATPEEGYHLTTDLADEAIRWLRTHQSLASERPYFLYFAPGAVHSPHHVANKWIDMYRGRFDDGWDRLRRRVFARQKELGSIPRNAELTTRPREIPSWTSLREDKKRLYARQMEVYAGFITHTDFEIGRLLDVVQRLPGADNTLILYIAGDNGASPGGADGTVSAGVHSASDQLKYIDELGGPSLDDNNYATGWTWLSNTPFKWWKMIPSHFGGTRAALVLSWPARIRTAGGVRSQFVHVNDVVPTIYDVTKTGVPSIVNGIPQLALDGTSFARTLDSPEDDRTARTQYFEMLGNRAIYKDGWMASARHWAPGLQPLPDLEFAQDRWELYHVAEDFSQAHDLAGRYPERLNELKRLFESEALRNQVYPFGGLGAVQVRVRSKNEDRREFIYLPGMSRLQRQAKPELAGRAYKISAAAKIPASGVDGVIVSYGGRASGFVLYARDSRLVFENLRSHDIRQTIMSDTAVPAGDVDVAFEFSLTSTADGVGWSPKTSTGVGRLLINGRDVGSSELTQTLGAGYDETFGVGCAFGPPVSSVFRPPFCFSGVLKQVKIELR